MLTRRTVIATGNEATYGTVAAATYMILGWDVNLDVKGEILKRDILRDTLSNIPHVIGMREIGVTFKTEIRAAGGGTNPEMHALLVGCAFGTATHTGTQAITYNLQSTEDVIKSTSLVIYKDGNKHSILGARGNVKFNFEAGKYGVADWDFKGLYVAVAASTTPDLAGVDTRQPPIIYNSSFQIAGFSPVCSKLDIDLVNEVTRRDDLNATFGVKSFTITGRKPKMTFRADAVVESSNPFWGDWDGGVVDSFGVNAGSAAQGQQVFFSGFFEYESPKYADDNGQVVYDCDAALVSSDVNTQNDELAIRFGLTIA